MNVEGIYTALVTPMRKGTVDFEALTVLLDRQLAAEVHGVCVCATTGEGSLLRQEEYDVVVRATVQRIGGRAKVVVATGTYATWATVEATRRAQDLGADAVLVAAPAYVRPSQEGLYAHFVAVADHGGLPVIVYNVPSRTSCDITPSTLARLAGHERIVAVKEATGSMQRVQQVLTGVRGRMAVLSGDDPITLSLLVAGGAGVICTASNVVPERWTSLWRTFRRGEIRQAATAQAALLGLHEALFLETNPGPVKAALHLLGLIEPEIRLPLTWPTPPTLYRLTAELELLELKVGVATR
ncbi:MAG: 4-hydroxy-tetrahydrodipicolinate synthase [Myxococcota bacterium]|nr:4-hydroxy-tetrahydrodipicolinate synthase [Myxococcota bacterium]